VAKNNFPTHLKVAPLRDAWQVSDLGSGRFLHLEPQRGCEALAHPEI
jgi:hypothetical protein